MRKRRFRSGVMYTFPGESTAFVPYIYLLFLGHVRLRDPGQSRMHSGTEEIHMLGGPVPRKQTMPKSKQCPENASPKYGAKVVVSSVKEQRGRAGRTVLPIPISRTLRKLRAVRKYISGEDRNGGCTYPSCRRLVRTINFTDALRNPVHLTQGPPGTGKSYLGVVLVRALMVIRRVWMQASPSVGSRPILVLSYKHHAKDEFLIDLLNAEEATLSGGMMHGQEFVAGNWEKGKKGKGKYRGNMGMNWAQKCGMVCMGNSGDPRLEPYTEKTSKEQTQLEECGKCFFRRWAVIPRRKESGRRKAKICNFERISYLFWIASVF